MALLGGGKSVRMAGGACTRKEVCVRVVGVRVWVWVGVGGREGACVCVRARVCVWAPVHICVHTCVSLRRV